MQSYNIEYKKTWALWGLFLLLIGIMITLGDNHRTVTSNYFDAAVRWFSGTKLYTNDGMSFIYLPQSAILMWPFTLPSFWFAEILWRVLSVGLFAFGIYRLASLSGQKKTSAFFPLMSIVAIPIAFSSARNGQMNLILAALMMLSLVDIKDQRFWRATILLTLGIALKPTMIAFYLLIFVLYPQMTWRLLIGLAVALLAPFLTQHPHYVWSQYAGAVHMLKISANVGTEQARWAQLFGMLDQINVHVSGGAQYILRIIAAVATLGLCFFAKQKLPRNIALFYIFALAACYLMLFNPRTENNDYAILAPAIGFVLAQAYFITHSKKIIALLVVIVICIIGGFTIANFITPHHVSWLTPLMALFFTIIVLAQLRRNHPANANLPLTQQKYSKR